MRDNVGEARAQGATSPLDFLEAGKAADRLADEALRHLAPEGPLTWLDAIGMTTFASWWPMTALWPRQWGVRAFASLKPGDAGAHEPFEFALAGVVARFLHDAPEAQCDAMWAETGVLRAKGAATAVNVAWALRVRVADWIRRDLCEAFVHTSAGAPHGTISQGTLRERTMVALILGIAGKALAGLFSPLLPENADIRGMKAAAGARVSATHSRPSLSALRAAARRRGQTTDEYLRELWADRLAKGDGALVVRRDGHLDGNYGSAVDGSRKDSRRRLHASVDACAEDRDGTMAESISCPREGIDAVKAVEAVEAARLIDRLRARVEAISGGVRGPKHESAVRTHAWGLFSRQETCASVARLWGADPGNVSRAWSQHRRRILADPEIVRLRDGHPYIQQVGRAG